MFLADVVMLLAGVVSWLRSRRASAALSPPERLGFTWVARGGLSDCEWMPVLTPVLPFTLNRVWLLGKRPR